MNPFVPWLSALLLALVSACASTPSAHEPARATAAPVDRPVLVDEDGRAEMARLIAPHVAQARATYPQARDRYLAGLPAGEVFYVTVQLRDASGKVEQVFVRVDAIAVGEVEGRLASDIHTVSGYHAGQALRLSEGEVIDWTISKPDGSEEGNFIGKFLDGLSAEAR